MDYIGVVRDASSSRLWVYNAYDDSEHMEIGHLRHASRHRPVPGDIVRLSWQGDAWEVADILREVPKNKARSVGSV